MIYVILPAFNEAASLQRLLPAIAKQMSSESYRIVLVDDGSKDSTPSLAVAWGAQYPLQYLRHDPNQGYGAAIRTGILWVIKNAQPEDIAITLDADNTHLPIYFPALTAKLREGFDVVTASYSLSGGEAQGVPPLRRLMSRAVNQLFRWTCAFPGVATYTNGFRAYRVSVLQRAYSHYQERLIEDPGFPGGVELFLKLLRGGSRAVEVPFTLYYQNRAGASKIRLLETIRRYLRLIYQSRHF